MAPVADGEHRAGPLDGPQTSAATNSAARAGPSSSPGAATGDCRRPADAVCYPGVLLDRGATGGAARVGGFRVLR